MKVKTLVSLVHTKTNKEFLILQPEHEYVIEDSIANKLLAGNLVSEIIDLTPIEPSTPVEPEPEPEVAKLTEEKPKKTRAKTKKVE